MQMTQQEIDEVIACMGDEIIESIQTIEREMILDFMRREENLYECGEDLAEMIEELGHYEDDSIH